MFFFLLFWLCIFHYSVFQITYVLFCITSVQFSSVLQSCQMLCQPHERQASLSITNCWSLPKPIPLSWWCHPTISSSVVPFSSCLQSFPGSSSFQMSQLFTSAGQSIRGSASTSLLPINTQDWFPLRLTGWISLQFKGLSRVFSNTTVQKHNSSVLSCLYRPALISIHDCWKKHSSDSADLCWQSGISAF